MRPLLLALAIALCATPACAQDAMAPLAPLIGCWRGAFEGNAAIHDERCFAPMLGGRYVRDVHAVRPTDYSGESIYAFDPAAGALTFTYYASDGAIARGAARPEQGAIVFAPHTYTGADGATQHLRATWRFESADVFVAESEREEAGTWRPLMRIRYVRTTPE